MTGILSFVSDPKVHDTALLSMAVTALLNALPNPKEQRPAQPAWKTAYEIFYEWITGFWSMKTGQKPNPSPPVAPAQK